MHFTLTVMQTPLAKKCGVALASLALLYPAWLVGIKLSEGAAASIHEALIQQASSMTFVLGPMARVTVDGKSAYALGTDACPGLQDGPMRGMYGESPWSGKPRCIVVAPTTKQVSVRLLVGNVLGPTEVWVVDRNSAAATFRRPDGSPVMGQDVASAR